MDDTFQYILKTEMVYVQNQNIMKDVISTITTLPEQQLIDCSTAEGNEGA